MQWAQNELKAIGSTAATEMAAANSSLIKDAEASCAEKLKYTQIGAINGTFTPGADNTSILDYLSGIESTKHMFTQLLTNKGQQQYSLFAINQEPDLVVTKKSSASTRTSHFSTNGQRKHKRGDKDRDDDDSDDEEDSDAEEPPPKSRRRNTTKDLDKAVHYTHEPPPPTGPPPRITPPQPAHRPASSNHAFPGSMQKGSHGIMCEPTLRQCSRQVQQNVHRAMQCTHDPWLVVRNCLRAHRPRLPLPPPTPTLPSTPQYHSVL